MSSQDELSIVPLASGCAGAVDHRDRDRHRAYQTEDADRDLGLPVHREIGRVEPQSRALLDGAAGLFILAIDTDESRREPDGGRYARRTHRVARFDPAEPEGRIHSIRTEG